MLLDGRRIGRFVAGHFPTRSRADGEEYVRRAQGAPSSTTSRRRCCSRPSLGASVGVAMWLLSLDRRVPSGGRYALFFGVWAGSWRRSPTSAPCSPPCRRRSSPCSSRRWPRSGSSSRSSSSRRSKGHILVPVIMGSRFRVHPLVVIFAVLAGGEIHGITGMLDRHPAHPAGQGDVPVPAPASSVRALAGRGSRRRRHARSTTSRGRRPRRPRAPRDLRGAFRQHPP